MKLNSQCKVRHIEGEYLIMMPTREADGSQTVVGLNDTSNYLWNKFLGREFDQADVAEALLDEFDVSPDQASADAARWLQDAAAAGLLEQSSPQPVV
ncbi:MAG: PqqD family protein [Bacteroidales bacterium]|nr:PqqD family protein [Bacteroidales bacterium]